MKVFWSELDWISSVNPRNYSKLNILRIKLEDYYTTNDDYYQNITGSESLWADPDYLPYQEIIKTLQDAENILEVGCGNAAVLSHLPSIHKKYHGVDFSGELIKKNRVKYPNSTFSQINDSTRLPCKDNSFDVVFSTFVLEHVIYPAKFMDESIRVLRKGGHLIVLCPDYLGFSWMASQRLGLGPGTGMEKLREKKILDAFLTGIDSRLRVPIYAMTKKLKAGRKPRFYINVNPVCFEDNFRPDVDAVYLTCKQEILKYTSKHIGWIKNSSEISEFCRDRRLIFLVGVKR